MGFGRFRVGGNRGQQNISEGAFTTGNDAQDSKHDPEFSGASSSDENLSVTAQNEKEVERHPAEVTHNAQLGQQKIEAAALVWSKKAVYLTYVWIWVCFFMLALQSAILNQVLYLAYADFTAAPAVSTAAILANIIGGTLKLPLAKTLNIWGRAEGYTFFVVLYLVALIVLATCTGPSGYAAGYVLYYIAFDMIYLSLQIFIADTSGLKNRAWAFALASTPYIATAFVGPLAADSLLTYTTWRWAVGLFAIVMPFVFFPLSIVFKFYERKAQKQGLFVRQPSGRSKIQSLVHYIHEFGVVGMFILMAAFILFLLPFSLVSYARITYNSAAFIAMVVIGFLLFFVFAAWEKYFARVHYIRWDLLRERTVLGACILAAVVYYSFYAWDLYYYDFVYVVYNLNYTTAGYMSEIYNVGSCFWGVVFGVYVRFTQHFKYACLFFGVPLFMLGSGLMIYFRGNDHGIGYVVMCQIFIAFSGGTLVIGEDMAVMASSDRDGVPMLLAVLGLFSSLGGAIGEAVAVSIYAAKFPAALAARLPEADKSMADAIYLGGYVTQVTYATGTPIREAINYAWGETQKWNCVSSLCCLVLAVPAVAIWKNYSVNRLQNKGTMI